MKIAICGSGSTGKSTLIEHLRPEFEKDGYKIIKELTRKVGKSRPINEKAANYDETQALLVGAHLNVLIKDKFLSDRSILDVFVYTNYLWQKHKVSVSVREMAHLALDIGVKMYDHIFYIPVEARVKLEDDGVRSSSSEFRKDIDHHMMMLIKNLKMDGQGKNIHTITGSVEERASQMRRIIKNGK